jgi:cyclophilin family peptidyl-prolyl cis-trans isomerase
MNLSLACLACLLAVVGSASGAEPAKAPATPAHPQVLFETSKGNFTIELYPDKAPKTVENFLQYVKSGFFDGTIFHRVIPDFMIQGGGFTADMTQKPTKPPVPNEADNRLLNERGTLAMARTGDPNSATAQFFVNLKNNGFLNFTGKTAQGWGYTVFGKVVEGMETVDAIAAVPTTRKGSYENVPVEAVVIKKATLVHAKK